MTTKKINTVPNTLLKFGNVSLNKAFWIAPNLFSLTIGPTSNSTKAPSYSYIPELASTLYDNGEKQLQRTVSAMLIAINKLVPDPPIPYPFEIISSKRIVTIDARTS